MIRTTMSTSTVSRATHFSVVWGITLAFLTILDWNSLGRDPANEQILLPFISREISLTSTPNITKNTEVDELDFGSTQSNTNNPKPLQYNVDIKFNGPYFLACFFIPVLAFQLIGFVLRSGRKDE